MSEPDQYVSVSMCECISSVVILLCKIRVSSMDIWLGQLIKVTNG